MKKRLDILMVERGMATGRDRAKALIMAGLVYVNGQKTDKAGALADDDDRVELRAKALKYVSRGGLKLEKALDVFSISLSGKTALDIGASTGGFTDCMLQNGAKRVACIDVGYGQLAWQLRNDPRVVCMERRNIRHVTAADIPFAAEFAAADVSFISLRLVLPVIYSLLSENGSAVCLIKPQFEAGRDKVGKNGVVRERETHIDVILEIYHFALALGFSVGGLTFSPITGPKGNIEYLIYLEKAANKNAPAEAEDEKIKSAVKAAVSEAGDYFKTPARREPPAETHM